MTGGEILSADALRREFARWYFANCVTAFVPDGYTVNDCVETFRMPDTGKGTYAGSYVDANGDIISEFRCIFRLNSTASKSGKAAGFVYYRLLRTYSSTPDVVPEEIGFRLE